MRKALLISTVLLLLLSSCGKEDPPPPEAKRYWLNTETNTLHNKNCQWYSKTKEGKFVTVCEGKNCGFCGGCK